ncbi:YpiF family protein [Virgibacillus sp. NKC19-3]|uniref:YpiF family protein n=1 Tax=Virgibacillus saliphilus TaxID=2831674 RepID=UPI001C9B2369|nr:YpiF family protein [Virgibacillus sp. NKC19-3]MBY7143498.1 YpiF family protein [Virgibacillus sp. NKC19-3]
MKWTKADIKKYIDEKEYIDTILIPLIPFHLSNDNDLEKSAFQAEVLSVFSNEIEKELTGRVLLTPNYYYLKSTSNEGEVERINTWIEDIHTQPVAHLFFITFDADWKKNEHALNGDLLWLPAIHSGDLHSKEMHAVIRNQVEQVMDLIRSYWKDSK